LKDVAIEIKFDIHTENHHTIKKKEKKKKKKKNLSDTKLIISRGTHICVIFFASINLDAKGVFLLHVLKTWFNLE